MVGVWSLVFAEDPKVESPVEVLSNKIVGTWQSIEFGPDEDQGNNPKIWKYYRLDGVVEVIYGVYGIKQTYSRSYQLEKGVLTEGARYGDDEIRWNVTFLDSSLKLKPIDKDYWILFEPQEEPSKDLVELPEQPQSLREALDILMILPEESIEEIRNTAEGEMFLYHMGLGRWIRNSFGLWGGSNLAQHFNENGVYHPDDMSSIILDSFWRELNNKPIRPQEKGDFYEKYWESLDAEDYE